MMPTLQGIRYPVSGQKTSIKLCKLLRVFWPSAPPDGKNPAVVLDASLFEPGSMWEPIQSYNASNYILPGSFWFESYNERIENSFPYSAMKNLGVIIEYWNSVCMITSKHFSYLQKSGKMYTYAYTIHWHDSNNYGIYA